jgi:hypothetical protein
MLQLSAPRACACGNAVFSGMASTADFKRQDFKESARLDLLSGLRSYRHREINMILSLTSPSV